jgi:proteasome lid subunit RPN8/RPN11
LVGKNLTVQVQVKIAIPMTNILHSSSKFRVDPKEQYDVFCWMDTNGLELVGIYHSHPDGPSYPSKTDQDEAYYPEIVHIIWAQVDEKWISKAFLFDPPRFREIEIQSADY